MAKYATIYRFDFMNSAQVYAMSDISYGSAGQVAVLDSEDMSCVWMPNSCEGMFELVPFMDLVEFQGNGVAVSRLSDTEFRVWLGGNCYSVFCARYGLHIGNTVVVQDSMRLYKYIRILLICDSLEGIYRITFVALKGEKRSYLNVWFDSRCGVVLVYAWGLCVDKGIQRMPGLSMECLKKCDRLEGRLAKSALLGGRLF